MKYPRTFHLPWSLGYTSDDKVLKDTSCFEGKTFIITEKMDGENSTLTRDYYHARSLDSKDHPSRSWIKQFHASIKHDIPEGWRICGENLYAKHSISYDNLKSYFYCFSIWDENNYCLSWKDTVEFCNILGVEHVPPLSPETLWGSGTPSMIKEYIVDVMNRDGKTHEGYVIRNAETFHFDDFKSNVAKYVRANHVTTDTHWMHSEIIPNKLKDENEIPD